MLELESARLRSENADLKAQVAGIAGVEDRRKKAEDRVTVLEAKVRGLGPRRRLHCAPRLTRLRLIRRWTTSLPSASLKRKTS